MDAILKVMQIAEEAAAYTSKHRRLCAMITIDVKNAFNNASWQVILNNLQKRKINQCLIDIIASYLSQRRIIIDAEELQKTVMVNSGVPQGSVLGPMLWNVLYDELLRIEMPDKTTLVAFADDLAIVSCAKDEDVLMNTVNWQSKEL